MKLERKGEEMLSKSDILFKILLTPKVSLTIKDFLFVCLFLSAEGVVSCICPAVEPACWFRQEEKEIKEGKKKKKKPWGKF